MPQLTFDGKSILIQVMTWWCQVMINYLSQIYVAKKRH